jgi:hypothetical protein
MLDAGISKNFLNEFVSSCSIPTTKLDADIIRNSEMKIIFISGHGDIGSGKIGLTDQSMKSLKVSGDTNSNNLGSIKLVFILDACESGFGKYTDTDGFNTSLGHYLFKNNKLLNQCYRNYKNKLKEYFQSKKHFESTEFEVPLESSIAVRPKESSDYFSARNNKLLTQQFDDFKNRIKEYLRIPGLEIQLGNSISIYNECGQKSDYFSKTICYIIIIYIGFLQVEAIIARVFEELSEKVHARQSWKHQYYISVGMIYNS